MKRKSFFFFFNFSEIKEEGLFRISSEQKYLNEIILKINNEKNFDYSALTSHTLACLLKEYLRTLPEPITGVDGCEVLCNISSKLFSIHFKRIQINGKGKN
jgi:hypothetical protein